jgi:hypothetical protein
MHGSVHGSRNFDVSEHIGSHLMNLGDSLASNPLPLQLYLAALTVLAIVLVVADRAVWRRNGNWGER